MERGRAKTISVAFLTGIMAISIGACSYTHESTIVRSEMELNTDRPGSDIVTLRLEKAKPALCIDACFEAADCKAWTYVKPGILGPDAFCRIKSAVPPPQRSSCCVSGIR